jgi:NADH-quinone oxidoreductase subunit N
MAAVLTAFMFSLTGIPPVAGFFGKFFIFRAAINAEMYTLAVIGVLSSVVAAFYYLRIVKLMYFDDPTEAFDRPIGREMTVILAGTSLLVLLFFVVPGPVISGAAAAVSALFAG